MRNTYSCAMLAPILPRRRRCCKQAISRFDRWTSSVPAIFQQLARRICPPACWNEHPIQNPCALHTAAIKRQRPFAHQPSTRPTIPAPISEGSIHELPLAKKSPGVANAHPIQQSVVMQNAEAIAVRTRSATSRRFTPSRLIRLVPFRKDLLDDECNGDLSPTTSQVLVSSNGLSTPKAFRSLISTCIFARCK
jgi:hypothetical protein